MHNLKKTNNGFKNFTRGGQIAFHNIRMWFQVNQTLFKVCKFIWLLATVGFTWLITPRHICLSAWYWCQAQVYPILKLLDINLPMFKYWYYGRVYYYHPAKFLSTNAAQYAYKFLYYLAAGAVIALVAVGSFIFYTLGKYLIKKGEEQTANKFIRGSQLDTAANVAKQIKKRKAASDIVIDDLPMLAGSEIMHVLVHGAAGTGKTQLIFKFLDHIRRRGDKVVVYDMGGIYTSIFYRKGQDKILNPLDARSENWDLWCEAREAHDFFNLATSLIPRPHYGDPYWPDSARSVFANAAFNMRNEDDRSIKKLLELLLTVPLEELYRYLVDTEASALMAEKIEKTALTIRSVIATYVKSLKFLTAVKHTQKPKFSIQNWLNNKNKQDDWLFLTLISEHHESLKPLLSMWFSMASICLMQPSLSRSKKVWIVCDELPSMHQQPQLAVSMAQSRKYGGCFILGMQNYAQLETIYSNEAKDIFDNMHTRFFFRSPSSNIAELISRELGSQEVENVQETYSYGANTIRDGITLSSQRVMHQIVTPAEIMDLEKMNCYVRLAGAYPVVHLNLKYQERAAIEQEFITGNIHPDPKISLLTDTIGCRVREIPKKDEAVSTRQQSEETKAEAKLQQSKEQVKEKMIEKEKDKPKTSGLSLAGIDIMQKQ